MRFSKKAQKWNNILHRDLGYLFAGLTVIYSLSGIALNHLHDWDPNYSIDREEFQVDAIAREQVDHDYILEILDKFDEKAAFKKHYFPTERTLKMFFKGGSVTLDMPSGEGYYEKVSRRAVFFESNFLHYNLPKRLWTWIADLFAVALIIVAITGLFILKGRNGITRRGAWLTSIGLLVPAIFLILYL